MSMKRIMIQADDDLLARTKRRAAERGVSIAAVVREALERELGAAPAQPEVRCAGAFVSDRGDLSRRASQDEYEPTPFR